MHANIQCPNCKKTTLVVELFGPKGNEFSTVCPVCGPVFGFVIFTTGTVASELSPASERM